MGILLLIQAHVPAVDGMEAVYHKMSLASLAPTECEPVGTNADYGLLFARLHTVICYGSFYAYDHTPIPYARGVRPEAQF